MIENSTFDYTSIVKFNFSDMVQLSNYWIAIMFCIFAMICWESWQNTQKMVQKGWRFELFYWDLAIGILLMTSIAAFTVVSMGSSGRTFIDDLKQADTSSIVYAMLGGLLWNMGNLLMVATISGHYNMIQAVIWFDTDYNPDNFQLTSSTAALNAYIKAINFKSPPLR